MKLQNPIVNIHETSLLVGLMSLLLWQELQWKKAYMGDTAICLVYVLLKVRKEACAGC